MGTKEKEPEDDGLVTRLEGAMGYEIELYEHKYDTKLQLSTENNFAAMVAVRDQLKSVVKRNALPTLSKKEKLTPVQLQHHVIAINLIDGLCEGLASHLLDKAKKGFIQSKIIKLEPKKIILPGQ